MDTSNLYLSYFTDSLTFSRHIVVAGADPSHSPDLRTLGGVFNCYLEGGKRGWVFGISMEPTLQIYIKTGKVATTKKTINVLDFPKKWSKKESGVCTVCKKNVKINTATKNYICYYAGGLPNKVTSALMDKEYRQKISVAFEDCTFICVNCMMKGKPTPSLA